MHTITNAKPSKVYVSELSDRVIVCDIFLTKNELNLNLKNKKFIIKQLKRGVNLFVIRFIQRVLGETLVDKMITYIMYSQIQSQCQFINSSIADNNTKVTVFRSVPGNLARGLSTDQACKGNIFGTDRKKTVIIVFTAGIC